MDALNEIRILASINHTNIVRYCEAFTEKDKLYIVMEYAERGDIYRQIKKHKNAHKYMKEDLVWVYLLQICQGLKELHSKHILHRVRASTHRHAVSLADRLTSGLSLT